MYVYWHPISGKTKVKPGKTSKPGNTHGGRSWLGPDPKGGGGGGSTDPKIVVRNNVLYRRQRRRRF